MTNGTLGHWIIELLKRRGLDRADGRLLFAYDLSQDEYESLGRFLSEAIASIGGIEALANRSLGRTPLMAPPAAFVLFAAEWWKHEYEGGVWDWSPIVKKLGADPDAFEPQLRSAFVARGLSFWQLSPLTSGKRFIGSIAVNGGVPMRLLALGAGPLATVLSQVLKLGARYRWGLTQLVEAVAERHIYLPAAYRRPEISELLAHFVEAVLQLREDYQLEGLDDPIAHLDTVLLDWRRRFPVALDSEAAQTLLAGLVREAAAQKSVAAQGLFKAERCLVRDTGREAYAIESNLFYPNKVVGQDLADLFGFTNTEHLPRYFAIDLETESRQPFAEGRMILGADEPLASLTGRKLVIKGKAACTEHRLVLRAQLGDIGERVTLAGGSALPDEDPWLFAESDSGQLHFVAAGGARLPDDSVWVALARGWTIETEVSTPAEELGKLVVSGSTERAVFRLRADARLMQDDLIYRIRLRQVASAEQIYEWRGLRLPEAKGRAVFLDHQAPRLFWYREDRLTPVPVSDQEWRRPGNLQVMAPKEARGPIEVRIFSGGEFMARRRIFVLPSDARIEYISGDALGTGTVRFVNWGAVEVVVEPYVGVSATISKTVGATTDIQLSSAGDPPSEFRVRIRWPGALTDLPLVLAYPVTGGRFIRAGGGVMQPSEQVTLRELIGMRLQVFDTNPAKPERYELQLALGEKLHQVSSRYPISVDHISGRAEVSLLEYERHIESLLGLFDDLDATVRVGLVVAGKCEAEIQVGRYTMMLEADAITVRASVASLAMLAPDDLAKAHVLASPLTVQDAMTRELSSIKNEGVHTGAWSASGLDPDLAPWLIYPAEDSALLFRPLIWVDVSVDIDAVADDTGSGEVRVPVVVPTLASAMSQSRADERRHCLHTVLDDMSEDHKHASWPLLDSLWQSFHHLPLTALDAWRMLAKQPKAILAFLLRSDLPDAELAEAVRRFRIETGWMPELTTVADLSQVSGAFWRYWSSEDLPPERCRKYFNDAIEGRFKLLANEIPSLGPLIETVVFAATGTISELLHEVAGPSKKPTRELLRHLWEGGNSLVNSQLFLVNEGREVWPRRDFVERHALPALLENLMPANAERVKPHLDRIFWRFDSWKKYFGTQFNPRNQPDFKFSVVNLPILCALWAATSTSRQWWSDPRSRLALKQIRDFDPIWFEQAYRQAFKVCMSIDGLVQLPEITDK